MLSVEVKNATGLKNLETFGKSDPYVLIKFQGAEKKTQVIKANLDPQWDETLEFPLSAPLSGAVTLSMHVMDKETTKDRLIGKAEINISQAIRSGSQTVQKQQLVDKGGKKIKGEVNMSIRYQAPSGGGSGGGGGASRGAEADPEGDQSLDEGNVDGNESGLGEGGDGDEGDGDGGGEGEAGGQPGPDGTVRKAKGLKASKAAQAKAKKFRSKEAREALPDKEVDFQVRIHCIEARRLAGGGSSLSPCCTVCIGSKSKSTSSVKSATNPVFDETLLFNFKERPKDLFDMVFVVKIVNSKFSMKDSLIGNFKMDVGSIYDEDEHQFVQKWVLLTLDKDINSGPKGYLKISVCVIGPGDDPKPFPVYDSTEAHRDDIESNLLRPSGVKLQPTTFSLKIYRGEDIPQMDGAFMSKAKTFFGGEATDKSDLVDPYVKVSFAGHSISSTKKFTTCNPVWNEMISLGVRFPSMCERMRIRLYDYDGSSRDDTIGTAFLSLAKISLPGDDGGFLPTFGPAWINFYGSTREFKDLADQYDHLNKGVLEGVAYRGRVLVSLSTELGKYPAKVRENIPVLEANPVLNKLRRYRHRLFVAFFHASQVNPRNSEVEYEVSIGNYGYKEDPNAPPSSSTTQATKPVYDGTKYYFLPWDDKKPCCVIPCQWEDNKYRIESMNILNHIAEGLENNIKSIKDLLRQGQDVSPDIVAQEVINVLDKLLTSLGEVFPEPDQKTGATELDIQWHKFRQDECNVIVDETAYLRERATDPNDVVEECCGFLTRIKSMASETQISIPDLIIWMLHDGERVAVTRVPAHEIYYSANRMAKGIYCGIVHTRFLKQPVKDPDEDAKDNVGSQVRFAAWLGREESAEDWEECIPGGTVVTFAETYQNQQFNLMKWGTKFLSVPDWSDTYGEMSLPKDTFQPPRSWRWDGEWFISAAESIEYDPELKMREIQEETYEVSTRTEDDQDWEYCTVAYEDDSGMKYFPPEEITCKDGWIWKDPEWIVDTNRLVDEFGLEYTNDSNNRENFQPTERADCIVKRKKLVRLRIRADESPTRDVKRKQSVLKEDEGWEFAVFHGGPYYRIEKKKHLFRRCRWLRKMVASDKSAPCIFKFTKEMSLEESGDSSDSKKSKKEKKEEKKAIKRALLQSPRMYMHFTTEYMWILRAYLYQARALLSGDKSGLADPYAIVNFVSKSKKTHVVKASVCPTFDETIEFRDISIYGEPEITKDRPPLVVVEFYDKDLIGKNELMGRTYAEPQVRLALNGEPTKLKWFPIVHQGLEGGELLGAFELILMDGINEDNLISPPILNGSKHPNLPFEIRPKLIPMRIEALAWGVRDMKKFELAAVDHPIVRLVCGDNSIESDPIDKASDNPNFPNPSLSMDCQLPREQLYLPPLEVQILDKRPFGRKPIVGVYTIRSLNPFLVHTPGSKEAQDEILEEMANLVVKKPSSESSQNEILSIPISSPIKETAVVAADAVQADEAITIDSEVGNEDPDATSGDEFDWWSRYYASIGEMRKSSGYIEKGFELMTYYDKDLESKFGQFKDKTKDFPLSRGKAAERDADVVGLFKGDIKVYPLPEKDPESIPLIYSNVSQSSNQEVTVRIYVIKGKNLAPQDPNGKSDPYIKIMLGEEEMANDKDNYMPNNLNPLFGKMFEITAELPKQHILKVVVMDHDFGSADDLIGFTLIDLENRMLSKFLAGSGLPKFYFVSGPSKWRQHVVPTALLEKVLVAKGLGPPKWTGNTQVEVAGLPIYTLDQFEGEGLFMGVKDEAERKNRKRELGGPKQRLALHILNQFQFVPDHIEQRKLINPIQGEIPQGYLEMYVDIFPKGEGSTPPPVDITPRAPQDLILRMVIWNTKDVVLNETAIIGGDMMSDIYVKAFLRGQDKSRKTDTHYRSMDGTGMFNWRLVFPFKYLPAEQEIIINKKAHFWNIDKTEKRVDPVLVLQVWDNDLFSPDDVLGTVEINLTRFFKPKQSARRCSVAQVTLNEDLSNVDNLFKRKRMKGWWPVISNPDGNNPEITGKVEMELEILNLDEAELRPAGSGQEDPNANPFLAKPNRPATSFPWFLSPWSSFKFIIWRHYKWWIILAIFLVLLILLIALLIYSTPGYVVQFLASFLSSSL